MVAILILLELTLQSKIDILLELNLLCRNPYFIGINSAIGSGFFNRFGINLSQSLFYWN